MFKDELKGSVMTEIIALKTKIYSFVMPQEEEHNKASGIPRGRVRHENYKQALQNDSPSKITWKRIKSKEHQLLTVKAPPMSLTAYDDKRYVLENGIDTLAYGHWQTQ